MDKKKLISIIIIIVSVLICGISVLGIILSNKKKKEKENKLEPFNANGSVSEITTEPEVPEYFDYNNEMIAAPFQSKDYDDESDEAQEDDGINDIQLFDQTGKLTNDDLVALEPKASEKTVDLMTGVFTYNGYTEEYEAMLRGLVDTQYNIGNTVFPDEIMNCFKDHDVKMSVNEIVVCEHIVIDYAEDKKQYSMTVRGYANVDAAYDGKESAQRFIPFELAALYTEDSDIKLFDIKFDYIVKDRIKVSVKTDGSNGLIFKGPTDTRWNLLDYDPAYWVPDKEE